MLSVRWLRSLLGSTYGQVEDQLRRVARGVEERPLDELVPRYVKKVHGGLPDTRVEDACITVALVRDGEPWLPTFLEHHLSLGARHVLLLDNGSVDDTVAIARRYRDVTVYRCTLPYRRFSRPMKRWLVKAAGAIGWVMLVDVDELFDYPGSSRLSLPVLLRQLNERQMTAVAALLLDMFPSSLAQAEHAKEGFLESHALYDVTDVQRLRYPARRWRNELTDPKLPHFRGGLRQRVFGLEGVKLIKHPLLRPGPGLHLETSHVVTGAKVADFVALLRHYKFVGDFREQVAAAVDHRQYYRASAEYRAYERRLQRDPVVALVGPGAQRFTSAWELVERGVLPVSPWYRALAEPRRAYRATEAAAAEQGRVTS